MNPFKLIVEGWKEILAISPQREKEIETMVEFSYRRGQCHCKCGCGLKSIRDQCVNCRVGVHKGK